jgi:DNA-directed RNA polymerase subunit M/transcription elongation factor TFIIS
MGSIIKAICKCGFDSGAILAGGNSHNFRRTCIAPAICLNCQRFLIKNYMKKHETCPNCGKVVTFYDNPLVQTKMSKTKKSMNIFSWHISDEREDFQLPNVRYLCPKCEKMTLKFVLVGYWD